MKIITHKMRDNTHWHSLVEYDEQGRIISAVEPVNEDGSIDENNSQVTFWEFDYSASAIYSRHCGNGEGCFWTDWELCGGKE